MVGVGEASGMLPIDSATLDYDERMLEKFRTLTGLVLRGILPQVLPAGSEAGVLSAEGARLLAPSGDLQPGIPLCPPGGDTGTGMVATNSARAGTGNASAVRPILQCSL